MKEQPRNINEPILSFKNMMKSIFQGLLIFIIVFVTYLVLITNNIETNLSITVTYSILVLSIMLIAYQLKNDDSAPRNRHCLQTQRYAFQLNWNNLGGHFFDGILKKRIFARF